MSNLTDTLNEAERLIAAGLDDKARAAVIQTLESDAGGQSKALEDSFKSEMAKIKGSAAVGPGKPAAKPAAGGKPAAPAGDEIDSLIKKYGG